MVLYYIVHTLTGCSMTVGEEPSMTTIFSQLLTSRIQFKLSIKVAHINNKNNYNITKNNIYDLSFVSGSA